MDNHLVELKNIELEINNKIILHNINLTIPFNQIITFIGPNGSGKTSLIKIFIGLIKPSKGKVIKAANIKFGYVPQKFYINELLPLTVNYFLKTQSRVSGTSDKFHEVIKLLKIETLLEKFLSKLSGGEMQLVLIARALLNNPVLLILDEPTQGLDVNGQLHFYQIIKIIKQSLNITIVIVSHDLYFVMKDSFKVYCINQHICCSGSPKQISENDEFQKIFNYSQIAQYLTPYDHEHDHKHS
jgi:zinc transport system ATP-binding protein